MRNDEWIVCRSESIQGVENLPQVGDQSETRTSSQNDQKNQVCHNIINSRVCVMLLNQKNM